MELGKGEAGPELLDTYEPERIALLADSLRAAEAPGVDRWCIFDNTVLGAATGNALALARLLAM